MTKPRKPYRPRPVRVPNIVGVSNIFAAPLKLLADIRHSFVLEYRGSIVMPTLDTSELYDAATTLDLFADILPELAGHELDTRPLRLLANRLRHDMPIDDAALAPVERLFELGQRLSNRIPPERALEILNGVSKPCN